MDKLFMFAGFVGCGLLTLALHKMCNSYARVVPSSDSLLSPETVFDGDTLTEDEDWDYELEEEGDDLKVVKPEPIIFLDAKGNVYEAPKIVRENIYGEQPFF